MKFVHRWTQRDTDVRKADGVGEQQLDSNYHKNILVEEREFMRMERKLKEIGPQGGREWGTAMISKGQQLS